MTSSTLLLPADVQSKLSTARRRLFSVDLALTLARSVLAATVAVVVVFALDTTLQPPLAVIRAFALFVSLVAAASITLFMARLVRRRLHDDDVALLVEREFPDLKDGLVSAVQLAREAGRDDLYTSRALIESTIERTRQQAAGLDFGRVVRAGPLIPLWTLLLAVLAFGGLLGSLPGTRPWVRTFLLRVVLGEDLPYPALVGIQVGRPLQGVVFDMNQAFDAAVVAQVLPGAVPPEQGLRPGDVLLEVAGEPVQGYDSLRQVLGRAQSGEEVALTVARDGAKVNARGIVGSVVPEAVAKGDEVSVDVLITKGVGLVERLRVHTRYEGEDDALEERDLLPVGPGQFRKAFQNVTRGFSFYVEDPVHGVASRKYTVRVVQRPRVEQYAFLLDYPDYTRKETESVSQPDLVVPAGTDLSYVVVSNKSLKSARLLVEREQVETDEEGRPRRVQLSEPGPEPVLLGQLPASALEPGGEWAQLAGEVRARGLQAPELAGRVLLGKLRVLQDVRFHFDLLSQEGYGTGKKPVVFSVRALADRKPTVTIPVPGRRKQVTPTAKLPLEVEARDDYGIADLELRLRPETPGEPAPQPFQALPLTGFEVDAKQVRVGMKLDVADQRLQPGDRLHYFAVAFDHNVDESSRSKESQVYEVLVVRPEDLERILQDRLNALKEQLETAAKDEEEARKQADAFVGELGPKDVLGDEDRRRLQRLGYDQRRVTSRLSEVQKELVDLAEERRLNRLEDQAAMSLLAELGEGVALLAERDSPQVQRELDEAREAIQVDARLRGRLSRIPDLQLDIVTRIRALAARIDKWGDFTEVIQEWRDLRRDQERIMEGTRDAAREEHR